MDDKCTRLLKELRKHTNSLIASDEDKNSVYPKHSKMLDFKALEEIAATASGSMTEICDRLLKKLEKSEKIDKSINQIHAKIYTNASKDGYKSAESVQKEELAKDSNIDAVETVESDQEEELSKHARTDEGKTTETFQEELFDELPKERKTFLIKLSVCDFLPEEVDVKVSGKYLEVHAKHEKAHDLHGAVSREFTRKFDIPENVDTETFRALFDCYNVLHVEASFKPISCTPREITVFSEDESAKQPSDCLGPEFEEMLKRHIEDGYEMAMFAINLSKQDQSDYIPFEEVITPRYYP